MDFQQWNDTLPVHLRIESLLDDNQRSSEQELRAALYMNLFSLSMVVLKGRIVHSNAHVLTDLFDYPETRAAVTVGLEAARSIAHIFRFLTHKKLVFRKSWLCM